MRLGSAAALALALALAGCSADYVEANQSPVILRITSINQGARLESDVKTGVNSDSVCPDVVELAVAVRPNNPNASIVQNAGDTVVADAKTLAAPCGPCRQILWEFCGDIWVHMENLRGQRRTVRLSELLPVPFDRRSL